MEDDRGVGRGRYREAADREHKVESELVARLSPRWPAHRRVGAGERIRADRLAVLIEDTYFDDVASSRESPRNP